MSYAQQDLQELRAGNPEALALPNSSLAVKMIQKKEISPKVLRGCLKMKGYFGAFGTYLKLVEFKTPEKVGGEEVSIPLNPSLRPQLQAT